MLTVILTTPPANRADRLLLQADSLRRILADIILKEGR